MHVIFYRTNDVFKSEEILNSNGIKTEIVPTPVQNKAYCGVCLSVDDSEAERVVTLISNIEYEKIL